MKIPLLLVVAALGLAIAGCGQKTAKAKTDEDATATGGSALTAPLDYLAAQVTPGSVVALLSNGAFGGIHAKLLERLAR